MYLLIFLELILIVAILLICAMKRNITKLRRENLKLHLKICQLKNTGDEKTLSNGHSHWENIEPSDLVYAVKTEDVTRMN